MPLRIAYYVHGRGRGHSTRAHYLLKKLILRKYKLKVYVGRDALPVLEENYEVEQIDSIFPESSVIDFIKRLIEDYRQLRKFRPDVLISDGDAPSTWVAKLLGIPILSIGHGLVFPYCKHPVQLPKSELLRENFKVRIASQWASHKFIIHFCELPTKDNKSILVKPDLSFDEFENDRGDYLISYFRDGNGHSVLEALTANGMKIKNFGHPVNINGIQNYPSDNMKFKQMLSGANGVVSSAGSNIIFESLALQKPLLLLYKPDDFEQKANAMYMEHLGYGLSSSFDTVQPELIHEFILSLETQTDNHPSFNVMPSLSDAVLDYLKLNFH
ncbi:MAG: glycosyltransferase family protein [Reichenbachiella sp.]|uniref:glycosyltransferase family protein n=1 Tax=Reichenbachiella sp. TaxID=2184521 RepID=UPI003297935F